MGTWGTAVFSDDTAADVRGDYRDLVGDGLSGPEATDRLLTEYGDELDDIDTGAVIWLALAATQWKCGRLEDRVKQKALEIIADGTDLKRWADEPALMKKRRAVLEKLKTQLGSPQPPEMRIPKRFRSSCDWEVGEVVSYRLRSGKLVLLRIIDHQTDKGGTSPVCELLAWRGDSVPSEREINRLPVQHDLSDKTFFRTFIIGATSEREFPSKRVTRPGVRSTASQTGGGWYITLWSYLDQNLEEWFGYA